MEVGEQLQQLEQLRIKKTGCLRQVQDQLPVIQQSSQRCLAEGEFYFNELVRAVEAQVGRKRGEGSGCRWEEVEKESGGRLSVGGVEVVHWTRDPL